VGKLSNSIYDIARYMLTTVPVDWRISNLTLTAWAGTPSFVPNELTVADIQARVGVPNNLGSSTAVTGMAVTTDGYNQTDPVIIRNIQAGKIITWFTMSQYHAAVNKSELYLFLDEVEGLPWTANGLDLVVQPDWLLKRGWFRA
jgi:hypothetical protein